MNRPKYIAAAALVWLFAASTGFTADKKSGSESEGKDMTPMADMLKSKSGEEFETQYLWMLTLHHQDGLKMGQMAMEKASSSELKQMMQKSGKEQQQDIDKMTAMLKKQNKSPNDFSKPAASEQMMQQSMSELQGLSGSEFDKKFAQKMAEHHMDAIAMSKMAESKAKSSEVKQLARKTVSSQTEERQKLMKMAKSSS